MRPKLGHGGRDVNKSLDSNELKFIIDAPAERDDFNAHSRVARAIAEVVTRDERVKVIGVLGGWGSGKSTVVRLVQSSLEQSTSNHDFRCFTYDAWLHQSDPHRRSFLEALAAFLSNDPGFEDLQNGDLSWKGKVEGLNKAVETSDTVTTPRLTKSGVWMLLTVLFLPLGTRLIGDGALEHQLQTDPASVFAFGLGWILTTSPIWVAASIYLAWRPWGKPINRRFLTAHRAPHEGESILSIVANRHVEQKSEARVRSAEPTAIEFQNVFREIMARVRTDRRRLVVIVDNLDRLPPDEAMTIWATVRSFFLGPDGGARPIDRAQLPTVIMPIDAAAIGRIYGGDDEDQHLSRSFIEKTFDLVFHVPTPVLSKWRQYLDDRLAAVFGTRFSSDERHIVITVYEGHISGGVAGTSPRAMNAFVNSVATEWLQRIDDPVHVSQISFFVLRRTELASDIYKAVRSQDELLASYDADWRTKVAALHYGVRVADAAELFMDGPIRAAIAAQDSGKFAELAATPGFESYFLRTLEQRDGSGAYLVSPAAAAIQLQAIDRQGEPWMPIAWRRLRQQFVEDLPDVALSAHDPDGVGILLRSADPADRITYAQALAAALGRLPEGAIDNDRGALFAKVAARIVEVAREDEQARFILRVVGGPLQYSFVLSQGLSAQIMAMISPQTASYADVVMQLASMLRSSDAALAVSAARTLSAVNPPDLDWAPLVEAAADLLPSGNLPGIAAAASVLVQLCRSPQVESRLRTLRDHGILKNAFDQIWHGDAVQPLADLAALLWRVDGPLESPDGRDWSARLLETPDLLRLIEVALVAVEADPSLEQLVQRVRTRPAEAPLYRAMAARRFDANSNAPPEPERLLADFAGFNDLFSPDHRPTFWGRVSQQAGFWALVESLPLDQAAPVLHAILESEAPKSNVAKELQRRFTRATAQDWEAALGSGSEPMGLVYGLDRLARTSVVVGDRAATQLRTELPKLLQTDDEAWLRRWFVLASRLADSGRRTLFRVLRDALTSGAPTGNLVRLLTTAGQQFIREAQFGEKADASVLHIVLPLIGSEDGRRWLLDHLAEANQWVAGSEVSTRVTLAEQLVSQRGSGEPLSTDLYAGLSSLPVEPEQPSPSGLPIPPISDSLLTGRWLLNFNPASPSGTKEISFLPDGTIGKGRNKNEMTWAMDGPDLLVIRLDGSLQNRFEHDVSTGAFRSKSDSEALGLPGQIIERLA